jgi:hypothetical protein
MRAFLTASTGNGLVEDGAGDCSAADRSKGIGSNDNLDPVVHFETVIGFALDERRQEATSSALPSPTPFLVRRNRR